MAERKEMLQDRYEDALFALLMEEMAAIDGEALLAENERLQNDPTAAVPEELDRRCLRSIQLAFAERSKQEWSPKRHRSLSRTLLNIAAVAAILAALFSIAYAASEFVRTSVNRLVTDLFPGSMSIYVSDVEHEIPQVAVGWLPDGVYQSDQKYSETGTDYSFSGEPTGGRIMDIHCTLLDKRGPIYDTEGAEEPAPVKVNNIDACLVRYADPEKTGRLVLYWTTLDEKARIMIKANGVSEKDLLHIARGLYYFYDFPKAATDANDEGKPEAEEKVLNVSPRWLPKDYQLMEEDSNPIDSWSQYGTGPENYILIEVMTTDGLSMSVDTAGAEIVSMDILGMEGMLFRYPDEGYHQLICKTQDLKYLIMLFAEGTPEEDFLHVARELELVYTDPEPGPVGYDPSDTNWPVLGWLPEGFMLKEERNHYKIYGDPKGNLITLEYGVPPEMLLELDTEDGYSTPVPIGDHEGTLVRYSTPEKAGRMQLQLDLSDIGLQLQLESRGLSEEELIKVAENVIV